MDLHLPNPEDIATLRVRLLAVLRELRPSDPANPESGLVDHEAWLTEWMQTPLLALQWQTPFEMAGTPEGQDRVVYVLSATSQGIYI